MTTSASLHAGFHFGLTPYKVLFKTEAIVDAVVDTLQDAAACVATLPGETAIRHRNEDAPILLSDVDNPRKIS